MARAAARGAGGGGGLRQPSSHRRAGGEGGGRGKPSRTPHAPHSPPQRRPVGGAHVAGPLDWGLTAQEAPDIGRMRRRSTSKCPHNHNVTPPPRPAITDLCSSDWRVTCGAFSRSLVCSCKWRFGGWAWGDNWGCGGGQAGRSRPCPQSRFQRGSQHRTGRMGQDGRDESLCTGVPVRICACGLHFSRRTSALFPVLV